MLLLFRLVPAMLVRAPQTITLFVHTFDVSKLTDWRLTMLASFWLSIFDFIHLAQLILVPDLPKGRKNKMNKKKKKKKKKEEEE